MTLPKVLEDAGAASEELRSARSRARAEALAAIHEMEGALLEALDGETLKGVREIVPGYAAVRARAFGAKEKNLAEPLPEPKPGELFGRWVLVVSDRGTLEMARTYRKVGRLGVESRQAEDEDLLIEDVEHLATLFAKLLGEHVERSRRSAARFGRLEGIARSISAALAVA